MQEAMAVKVASAGEDRWREPGDFRIVKGEQMKSEIFKILMIAIINALLCLGALAGTKSDYDRSYDFANLKTWDFKVQTRMPSDPVGTNTIWNQDIQQAQKTIDKSADNLVKRFTHDIKEGEKKESTKK
jgi:hypothetical protein